MKDGKIELKILEAIRLIAENFDGALEYDVNNDNHSEKFIFQRNVPKVKNINIRIKLTEKL